MANEPVWLDADLLIEFNQLEVSATGEPHLLRDLAGHVRLAKVPMIVTSANIT